MIGEILVAQDDAEDMLANQRAGFMLDQICTALVLEADREAIDQAERPAQNAKLFAIPPLSCNRRRLTL